MIRRNLLDVNVLIAFTDLGHEDYHKAQDWFDASDKHDLGICPLTEAGFVRVTTNPSYHPGPRTLKQAIAILDELKAHPRYWYWEIDQSWVTLTAPFAARIFGHQQITDAYLLGLAIKNNGVLVTFDRGLKYMAGAEFSRNLLILD